MWVIRVDSESRTWWDETFADYEYHMFRDLSRIRNQTINHDKHHLAIL